MNKLILLRLMVSNPLVMNMSNSLGYVRGELRKEQPKQKSSFGKRVLAIAPIKKLFLAIYNWIFKQCYR